MTMLNHVPAPVEQGAKAAIRRALAALGPGEEADTRRIADAAEVEINYANRLLYDLLTAGEVTSRRAFTWTVTPTGRYRHRARFWRRVERPANTCLHIYQTTGPCGCYVHTGRVCYGLRCVQCGHSGHWLRPVRCEFSREDEA